MAKHQSSCKCDRCRRTIEMRKAHARRVFERTQGNLFAAIHASDTFEPPPAGIAAAKEFAD